MVASERARAKALKRSADVGCIGKMSFEFEVEKFHGRDSLLQLMRGRML
jgi:hypothetical protein